ncbi:MAG: ABC transporter substrate-binding protein [Ramlibacter sp.]
MASTNSSHLRTRRILLARAGQGALLLGTSGIWRSALGAVEKASVTVQTYPGSLLNLPLHIGADQKLFEKRGLQVVISPVPSGPLAQQALVTGDLDIAYGSSDPGIAAHVKGADTQIFLGLYNANVWALVGRKGLVPDGPAKPYPEIMQVLKGKKVGVTGRGAASEFIVRSMFENAGLSGDDATYIAVGGPATAYPALVSGTVDVVLAFEPMITLADTQQTGRVLVDLRKGAGPKALQNMNGAFVTFNATRAFLTKNPGTARAFQEGLIESVKWMQNPANKTAVGEFIVKYVSIGKAPNQAAVVDRLIAENVGSFGWTVDRNSIAAYSDFLLKNKLIPVPVDPLKYVADIAPRT